MWTVNGTARSCARLSVAFSTQTVVDLSLATVSLRIMTFVGRHDVTSKSNAILMETLMSSRQPQRDTIVAKTSPVPLSPTSDIRATAEQ